MACSPALGRALRDLAPEVDVIHNHGVWLAPNIYPGLAARASRTPLLLAPRGTLSEEALVKSRWKKRLIWPLQKVSFDQADCFHATAEKEYEEIRAFGQRKPVAVIPNGVDLPAPVEVQRANRRTLLFLGRIHPIKGLDLLLEVWRDLPQDLRRDWTLRIVGDDADGHQAQLEAMVQDQGIPAVEFPGPAFGDQKTREYAQADLYILPTKTENFGMTIAESLAAGTPVITTRGAPWDGLEQNGCGWWIERSGHAVAAALTDALARPREDLDAMGERGRAWVDRAFGWRRIAQDMIDVYRWLAAGRSGEPPQTVRID